jgi:hypothetical protein
MRLFLAVALLCLVCGCATTCKEPMKRVGKECCIDANDNKICDGYETNSTDITCEPPFIEYNMTCCLDTNGNGQCDGLEAAKKSQIPVIIPTKRTTTTTILNGNDTEQATSSTIHTTTTSTTTTTDRWAPTTTLPTCYDDDGGDTPRVVGTVSGLGRVPPHERMNATDYCKNNLTVLEYRCSGDYVYGRDILCGSFEMCKAGRCCLPKGIKCGSSNDCCSGECIRKQMVGLCY